MEKDIEIIKELNNKVDIEKLKIDRTKIEDINVYRATITDLIIK